jgi:hypothetical protein
MKCIKTIKKTNSREIGEVVRTEEKDAELKTLKQISEKFYKKDLKPYLKDQIMVWDDLDKFVFNKEAVLNAIKEFNKFYETTTTE